MIAVDTNILVYAHREESIWNKAAGDFMQRLCEGTNSWAIPWPCLYEFVSVVTNQKVFKTPSPLNIALAQIDAWLESPSIQLLAESHFTWLTLKPFLVSAKVLGPKIHDARIAQLCLENGVKLFYSADRDFSRFPKLKTLNPLIS